MPMLDPRMFGGGDYGEDAPYPNTSMMGMLTKTPMSPDIDPLGWGRPVSLEGGVGPGTRAGPPAAEGPTPAPRRSSVRAEATSTDAPSSTSSAPGSILNKLGDFLNNRSTTLMAMGAGFAGAPNIGAGISRGLQFGIPAQQQDIQLQRQNATVSALMKRGIPQDVAMSAVQNPEIMKQIIGQVFGPKAYQHVTLKTAMGDEVPMSFDPTTGKYNKIQGIEGVGGSNNQPLPTGEEYLQKHVDPQLHNSIRAMARGDIPASGMGSLKKLTPYVENYDPTFSAANYPTMLKTRQSYTSGKDFAEVQALNTVSGHMLRLADAAEGLGNTGFKPWNYVKNAAMDATVGSPPLVKFRNDLVTTQNELAKAYHGGHVSDSAYNNFNKAIGEAQTPAELKTAIGEIAGLLQSKIEAKESGYRDSMGKAPLPENFKATNAEARHSFGQIKDWAYGGAKSAGGSPGVPVAPVRVSSPAEARKLPKGTPIILPDGSPGVVP